MCELRNALKVLAILSLPQHSLATGPSCVPTSADSVSQRCMGGLSPLSLCCMCVQILFNLGYVKILSSPYGHHLPELPVKSPDNLSAHFLPETHLQFQANGANDLLVNLPPRSPF